MIYKIGQPPRQMQATSGCHPHTREPQRPSLRVMELPLVPTLRLGMQSSELGSE